MKKNNLFLIFLFIGIGYSFAQISHGGAPYSFGKSNISREITFKSLPEINVQQLMNEDALNVGKDAPYRFGKDIDVYYNMFNSGKWETLANGDKLWRMGIHSDDAVSLNFICNQFFYPYRCQFIHIQ